MGGIFSKKRGQKTATATILPTNSERDERAINLKKLKHEMDTNLESFVLNNLLLSVQFFKNYELEIKEAREQLKNSEDLKTEENKEMSKLKKKSTRPNHLIGLVSKHVLFRPQHGEKRRIIEPLDETRIFISSENVTVLDNESNSIGEYVDYIFLMEGNKDRQGFVILKKIMANKTHAESNSVNSTANRTVAIPSPENVNFPRPGRSVISAAETHNTESGITRRMTRPVSILDIRLGSNTSGEIINEECFRAIKVKQIDEFDELNFSSHAQKKNDEYLICSTYLKVFFDLFIEKISQILKFSHEVNESAETQGGEVYCETYEKYKNTALLYKTKYNILPSFETKWPKEVESAWNKRNRNIWLTKEIKDFILSKGCHLIPPNNILLNKAPADNHDLEWSLAFPEAESYLELTLSYPQVRCYLFTLLIFKTFLGSVSKNVGLRVEEIRNAFFHMCEKRSKWLYGSQGEMFKLFLGELYSLFQRKNFPHFFIPNVNSYNSQITTIRQRVQKELHDVKENIVISTISALQNLRYIDRENFYPILDYNKLLQILLCDEPLLILNPLLKNLESNEDLKNHAIQNNNKKRNKTPHKQQNNEKNLVENENKKFDKLLEDKKNLMKIIDEKPDMEDEMALDVRMINEKPNILRQSMILEMFIPHFIKIAEKSIEYENIPQSIFYIKQTNILLDLRNMIFRDRDGFFDENAANVANLITKVKQLQKQQKDQISEPQNVSQELSTITEEAEHSDSHEENQTKEETNIEDF